VNVGPVCRVNSRSTRILPLLCVFLCALAQARTPLVLLTDFGTQDGAVAAMKGVAYSVSQDLLISDLSHENPSIFDGAYRLYQTEQFWPRGTVFVAVVDPGVGTERLSVVLKTRTGRFFVGPDNGLLSLVAERDGIEGLRQIDERVNRRFRRFAYVPRPRCIRIYRRKARGRRDPFRTSGTVASPRELDHAGV
jgi:hypothetical protein